MAALIKKEGLIREIIINSKDNFLFPDFEFQEIYKYKNEILEKSGYSEAEFIQAVSLLLGHMRIIKFEEICNYYNEASAIISKIDQEDIIFIATALAFNAKIWSDDTHFKMQDKIKCLTTPDMKNCL